VKEFPFAAFFDLVRVHGNIRALVKNMEQSLQEIAKNRNGILPPLDMVETQEDILLLLDLPGVDPSSLSIDALGNALTISGIIPKNPTGNPIHQERPQGNFSCAIPLPMAVNPLRAIATLENGVLEIRFPKVPERRGDLIHISLTSS